MMKIQNQMSNRLVQNLINRFSDLNNRILICVLSLGLTACIGGSNDSAGKAIESEVDLTRMMANYADNLIIPSYENFYNETLESNSAVVSDYCASIGTATESASRVSAQTYWRNLMALWQQTELFILGPAAANGNARRNAVYSYASTSPTSSCAIDQSVVLAQEDTFDIKNRSFNSRGIDALEYLLFNDNLAHTCPVQITQTQGWDALPELDRKQQRCQYAERVLIDIRDNALSLVNAWSAEGGDFRTQFVNPANLSTNLDALSDALFYIELETKDIKLGLPTGIHADCTQVACPGSVESRYSEHSLINIRENLEGFRLSLMGGEGLGFDDIINARGFPQVVDTFNSDIDAAITLIGEMDESLLEQSENLLAGGNNADCINSAANPDSVRTVPMCSLHGYVKRITDALRIDFITIVDLDLPDRGQSDAD